MQIKWAVNTSAYIILCTETTRDIEQPVLYNFLYKSDKPESPNDPLIGIISWGTILQGHDMTNILNNKIYIND